MMFRRPVWRRITLFGAFGVVRALLLGITALAAVAAIGCPFATPVGDESTVPQGTWEPPTVIPQLRWPSPFPTEAEVELGADGKYLIRGRADGCDYEEDTRTPIGDGRTWVLMRSPGCAEIGLLVPGQHGAVDVMGIPTPTTVGGPRPTPTPEPAVCPSPVRQTPADFAEPPPTVAPSEIVGWRVQGGVSFSAGYLTIHPPAGRELAVMHYWDGSEDQQYVHVLDIETQSALTLRGDGCETSRFTREPAADPVFDEVVATLEVGSVYVCPAPFRRVLSQDELLPEPTGERVTGGSPGAAKFGLDLPAGREFIVWVGISDPGGGFTGLYDVATRSWLFLGEEGCETSRRIADPEADAVFDEIVGSTEVPR